MTFEIISIILNGVLSSGLVLTLIKYRSEKQKANTEIKQGEVDLVASSVRSMIASQQTLMQHNEELVRTLTTSRRENAELSDKLDELKKR